MNIVEHLSTQEVGGAAKLGEMEDANPVGLEID